MKELNGEKYFVCKHCGTLQFSDSYKEVHSEEIMDSFDEEINIKTLIFESKRILKKGEYSRYSGSDDYVKIRCKNCGEISFFNYMCEN